MKGLLIAVTMTILSYSTFAANNDRGTTDQVTNAANQIVQTIDHAVENGNDFHDVYNNASLEVLTAISATSFNDSMKSTRGKLGSVFKRKLLNSEMREVQSKSDTQSNFYIIVSYFTQFHEQQTGYSEYLTLKRDYNSEYGWVLAGYHLKKDRVNSLHFE